MLSNDRLYNISISFFIYSSAIFFVSSSVVNDNKNNGLAYSSLSDDG